MLYNYAVRVDMLRDLRLAGGTTKRSLLYAATLETLRYHEHRNRTFEILAHLRYVHANANAEYCTKKYHLACASLKLQCRELASRGAN